MQTDHRESENADWLSALNGERVAREEAIARLTSLLKRNLRRALRKRGDAVDGAIDDFVQEALIKIMGSLDRFRGDSRFTTWATAIAVRTALTALRRAHWKNVSLDALALDTVEPGFVVASQEQDTQQREVVALLYRLIEDDLTSRQREAVLGALAGVPQAVMTERLGLKRNALYKLEHDARKKLGASLARNGISAQDVQEIFGGDAENRIAVRGV